MTFCTRPLTGHHESLKLNVVRWGRLRQLWWTQGKVSAEAGSLKQPLQVCPRLTGESVASDILAVPVVPQQSFHLCNIRYPTIFVNTRGNEISEFDGRDFDRLSGL